MNVQIYYIMHVVALVLLTATTFQACADPSSAKRKSALMWSGIMSLLMLVGGFGLMARLSYKFDEQMWIIPKIVCWFGLTVITGMAFRKPGSAKVLKLVAGALVIAGIYLVYVRPM